MKERACLLVIFFRFCFVTRAFVRTENSKCVATFTLKNSRKKFKISRNGEKNVDAFVLHRRMYFTQFVFSYRALKRT